MRTSAFEEGSRLNNFACEPKIYQAEPPTKTEQQKYILWGMAAESFSGQCNICSLLSVECKLINA